VPVSPGGEDVEIVAAVDARVGGDAQVCERWDEPALCRVVGVAAADLGGTRNGELLESTPPGRCEPPIPA
jgi:hypothetical protein